MKRIHYSPMLFITLVSISLFATFAEAATLEVGAGKPYTTIQSAIDAAGWRDTILVYEGIYVENVNIWNSVTVKSISGAANTIIDGNQNGTVMTLASDTVLDGFTIQNGNALGSGGGIYCQPIYCSITNCIISGNTAYEGGGIYSYGAMIEITNSTINDNMAGKGGGIYSITPAIEHVNFMRHKQPLDD